jgi:AI-2E family transporter
MFVALQQLEGHLVAPQVFRISLRINPILVILSLLIGFQLYGVAGSLVALPVVAVLRETAIYLRRHLVLEPWGPPASPLGVLNPPQEPKVTRSPQPPRQDEAPAEGEAETETETAVGLQPVDRG